MLFSAKIRWKKREKNRKKLLYENALEHAISRDLVQIINDFIADLEPPENSVYITWLYSGPENVRRRTAVTV